ncbi:MAG: glycosyltransferase [Bacteroidales bacterium]|nr:glycosyltransferase [Bacteroidales bacterium]
MKILHILATLGTGGIQGFVYSLAYEQARMGHEVMVVLTDICDDELGFKQEHILVENRVKVVRLNRHEGDKLELIKSMLKFRKLIEQFKPDIVNSHSKLWHLYGAIGCFPKRYQQICTVHTTPERWSTLVNLFCRNKPVIYCSKASYEGRVQKNKKVICIENGIAPNLVRTNEIVDLRKEYELPPESRVVVSVGNLRPAKNYKNLVELAKLVDGDTIHFFICGNNLGGPAYDDPKQYEGYRNLHCLGSRSDVSAIENAADLFLSSSTYEGLPIAVLEAYFNGIPCVLSSIKQHAQIADVPKVWMPKDFEPESFLKTIEEALMTSESHDAIYEMRKPFIEKYSITRTARDYMDFYAKTIEKQ